MAKKKVWVVIRPSLDIEDSMDVVAVALTQPEAEAVSMRINVSFQALRARLKKMPDAFEEGISEEEHALRWDARQEVITRARWPYGYSFESDLSHCGNVASVMAAPLITGGKP